MTNIFRSVSYNLHKEKLLTVSNIFSILPSAGASITPDSSGSIAIPSPIIFWANTSPVPPTKQKCFCVLKNTNNRSNPLLGLLILSTFKIFISANGSLSLLNSK